MLSSVVFSGWYAATQQLRQTRTLPAITSLLIRG